METEFTDPNKPIVGQYTKMVSNRKSTTAQITRVAYALSLIIIFLLVVLIVVLAVRGVRGQYSERDYVSGPIITPVHPSQLDNCKANYTRLVTLLCAHTGYDQPCLHGSKHKDGNVEHIIPIAILAEQCCIDECTIDHIAERFCCKTADCASKCYNIEEPTPSTTTVKTTAAPIVKVTPPTTVEEKKQGGGARSAKKRRSVEEVADSGFPDAKGKEDVLRF
ncbi:hypothetical protein AAVH_28479 [Aphelenchoides avenae]|nr:hypothetical protein AAVH_28479 [Aphelenchus avenae]